MRQGIALRIVASLTAASFLPLAAPAFSAPGHHPAPPRHDVRQDHRWSKGERFDRNRASHYAVVDYHRYRGLKAPPRGYHWVRSGNDAVLVAITGGLVAAVVANAIH